MTTQTLRRILVAGAVCAALALAACTTAQTITAAQDAEKADAAALTLYATTASVLNGLEALPGVTPAQTVKYEAIRTKAWQDLATANALYNAGKAIDLTVLQADVATAQTAGAN